MVISHFGGNLMERKSTGLDNSMGKLTAPDLFSLANGDKKDLSITETYIHKKSILCMELLGSTIMVGHSWMQLSVMTGHQL